MRSPLLTTTALCLTLLPLSALADTFPLTAPPTAVTAYAEGAIVTRTTTVDLPAGTHTLQLADMDPRTQAAALDITLTGASILSRSWDANPDTPYRAPRTPEWVAAKAALDAATDERAAHQDAIALALAKAQAAQDQIGFLNGITLPDDAATNVDMLRAIGQLIASDGTAARSAIRAAEAEARALRADSADLAFAVETAQAALDAVTPTNDAPAMLSLDITVPAATTSTITVNYTVRDVYWAPVYTAHLDDTDTLRIERSAMIQQYSNEDWSGVDMILSTLSLNENTSPGTLRPRRLRIEDPQVRKLELSSRQALSDYNAGSPAEPVLEAPVIVEAAIAASADFNGIGVSYTLPAPVSLRAGSDAVQIALDTLEFDAALSARAVPLFNETAYRQVSFTNTSPEILLPGAAFLYVDGQPVGNTQLGTLPPNADADVFFGAIEGLRLKRTVLDRNEGDRGIISRSNEQREEVRLEIENLTGQGWDVALRDRVPFSEQEDLEIAWRAAPAPSVEAVDDQRGILEWQLQIEPGQTQTIALETTITWPDGMTLR